MALTEINRHLRILLNHSIKAVAPRILIRKELILQGNILKVKSHTYKLNKNCYLIGFGKAALDMGLETETILKDHIRKGVLSVPKGIVADKNYGLSKETKIRVFEGAKDNTPDEEALEAAAAVIELVKPLTENDMVIVLISGGGSALLPYPRPPLRLKEKVRTIQLLGQAGANIRELNTVRQHLSGVKGGRLAELAYPATVLALVLSDIVGDPLSFVASGPTVFNSEEPGASLRILRQYSLLDKVPHNVLILLERQNTLVDRKYFENVQNVVIGNNGVALAAACEAASSMGYPALVVTTTLEGHVGPIAESYARLALLICQAWSDTTDRASFTSAVLDLSGVLCLSSQVLESLVEEVYSGEERLCLMTGGETTAVVEGNGLGGRNQELALRFSQSLDGSSTPLPQGFLVSLLSAGSDGIDGPTDAAGALAYTGQTEIASRQGIDPRHYITNNDSYNYYSRLNNGEDLIKIGHTGTNVMDIHILIIQHREQL